MDFGRKSSCTTCSYSTSQSALFILQPPKITMPQLDFLGTRFFPVENAWAPPSQTRLSVRVAYPNSRDAWSNSQSSRSGLLMLLAFSVQRSRSSMLGFSDHTATTSSQVHAAFKTSTFHHLSGRLQAHRICRHATSPASGIHRWEPTCAIPISHSILALNNGSDTVGSSHSVGSSPCGVHTHQHADAYRRPIRS